MEQHRITSVLVVDARRRAGRRAELERPDAREGHLMAHRSPALELRAGAAARGARHGRASRGDLRRRRRAHRRPHLHRRARRGVQGLLDARRPRPEAARARRHRADRRHRPRFAGGAPARGRPRHRARRLRRRRQAGGGRRRCSRRCGLDWDAGRRDRRRLARPAADAARRVRLRAAERARRSAGGRAPRHRGARRPRRGARVLRPAAACRRPLRRAAARRSCARSIGAR